MLTEEAYLARKWRGLPLLRRVIEGQSAVVDAWWTSVDQTFGERVGELYDIGRLAVAHQRGIADLAVLEPADGLHGELAAIAEELTANAGALARLAEQVSALHDSVEQARTGHSSR